MLGQIICAFSFLAVLGGMNIPEARGTAAIAGSQEASPDVAKVDATAKAGSHEVNPPVAFSR